MMDSAYNQGFRARLKGLGAHENPYAPGTQDRALWASGWLDQHHHLSGRDEALASIGWDG